MLFWIITAAMALGIAGTIILALLKTRPGEEPPAAYDLRVYRDQLKEVDKDLARGVIGEEDAERTRAEISRRILAADAQLQQQGENGGQPQQTGLVLAALAALGLVGGSIWLYAELGAPGYDDLGLQKRMALAEETRASRPGQSEAEETMPPAREPQIPNEDFAALMDKLRSTVAERPEDVQGLRLLARNEASLGNFKAAYEAQEQAIAAMGDEAGARDYVSLADAMILNAGGYVSPEAEAALLQALKRDPRNGVAQYYMGLMFIQVGRPDAGFQAWNKLLRESPSDAPWIPPIRAQIGDVAQLAGVDFTLPGAAPAMQLPGPSAEDLQAASDMSEADRQQMIQTMVAGLADRLANQGGTPEEWARLISAYGVLGNREQAERIWAEAQHVFADRPEALATVRDGAKRAGVAE